MPLATSQSNQPALANLPSALPRTQAEWQGLLNALAAWKTAISSPQWIAPTFQNGWTNYGGSYEPAGYYMDVTGRVHLRGLVKGGTVGISTPIFTLPKGYYPPYIPIFSTDADAAFGEVRIGASGAGTVCIAYGSNVYLSLAGISFLTS